MSSSLGLGTDAGDDGSVLDTIKKLLVADPAQCDRGGLELLVRRSLRVRGWLGPRSMPVSPPRPPGLAAAGASADSATVLGGGGRRSRPRRRSSRDAW